MTQQTEAQRLADLIQRYRSPHCGEAAAELRRQEAVIAQLLGALLDLKAAIKSRGVIPTVKALSKTDAAIAAAKDSNAA
jgi:hypothetical protein